MLKIGIIGQKRAGKTTVYNAVAGADTDPDAYQARDEVRRIVVKVPDARLDQLHKLFAPPKKISAEIEYFDFPGLTGDAGEVALLPPALRESNALIMVLRGFGEHPDPTAEAELITEELVIADLMVLEKRLDRLKREVDSGHVDNKAEYDVLVRAAALLDAGTALRELELSDHEEVILRGYAFLSRMPIMGLINVPDDGTDITEADWGEKLKLGSRSLVRVLRGQLESELVSLDDNDRAEFMKDYALEVSALDGMVASCYSLLGMITYFTGSSETDVRAWTVRRGAKAPEAAGVIHSDFEKGFIRAEVFGLDDLLGAGSTTAARKAGKARLEGRDYIVTDGDYILFRFNV